MDDPNDQPLADDLSYLDDLDRGLELDHGFDRDRPTAGRVTPRSAGREPSQDHHHPRVPSRRRPLLDRFPLDAAQSRALDSVEDIAPVKTGSSLPPAAAARRPPYGTFYGLNENPFGETFDPRFVYHGTAHDRTARGVVAAIERRDAAVLLTGAAGSGKTTVCRSIINELEARIVTSLVPASFVTIEELVKRVLIDFGAISHADLVGGPLAAASRRELTMALKEFLLTLAPLDAFAVIFVDDAHDLSAQMMDRVRALSTFDGLRPLVQLVMVGEPSLLMRVERPGAHQGEDVVTVRCELGPLDEAEIAPYVNHRLAVSGDGRSRVALADGAFAPIYHFSQGIPAVVNRICDRALTLGYEQSAGVIDAGLVESAGTDLDLVPAEPPSVRAWRFGLAAVALVALMLAGATAGMFVFGARVQRVAAAWQAIPLPPPPPSLLIVSPAVAVPLPDAPSASLDTAATAGQLR